MGEVEQQQQIEVKKTAEELKRQQEKDTEERTRILASRIPKFAIDGLDQSALDSQVRAWYDAACKLEEEKYDLEFKLRKLDTEINELNIIVNDIKGHFVKPSLKKVSKTEQKLAKIAEVKKKLGSAFRDNLKSTGQSKYSVDDPEQKDKPDWGQDNAFEAEAAVVEEEEEEEEE